MRTFITRGFIGFATILTLAGFPITSGAQSSTQQPIHVTLLQVNDVYQISPVDKGAAGGLARVATLIKQVEAQNPNTFFVLAGDTLSPSIASKLFQGKQMIDVWNHLGLDIAALGNHEFDFGNDILLQRMQESQFTWVNANVVDTNTGKPFGSSVPYAIKTINGVKIGFFGLLTPDTKESSYPGANVRFDDPLTGACRAIRELNNQNVDVIIAVTHLSLSEDKQLARSLPLRMALIMGGHEHTLLQSVAGGIPIYKMGSDARALGRMDLWIDPNTHRVQSLDFEAIPVTAAVSEDPTVATLVKTYEDKINTELGQTIGQTSVVLDAVQKTNRTQETNLGNFIADTYRKALNTDVVILNSGGIRSNTTYGPGPLTRRDILSILPFGNHIIKAQVSGLQIKQALEHGVSLPSDEEAGRFPHVAGIRFTYDTRKPVGSRVTSVTINGQPLNEKKLYTLASTTYLLDGGDGYTMLKNSKLLIPIKTSPLETDLIENAIRQVQAIAPKTDGRIKRVN